MIKSEYLFENKEFYEIFSSGIYYSNFSDHYGIPELYSEYLEPYFGRRSNIDKNDLSDSSLPLITMNIIEESLYKDI